MSCLKQDELWGQARLLRSLSGLETVQGWRLHSLYGLDCPNCENTSSSNLSARICIFAELLIVLMYPAFQCDFFCCCFHSRGLLPSAKTVCRYVRCTLALFSCFSSSLLFQNTSGDFNWCCTVLAEVKAGGKWYIISLYSRHWLWQKI